MDQTDVQLIRYLSENADITSSALVPKLNLSIPAINKRIAKLKDEGVILRSTIITDGKKVGKPILAFVLITLDHFTIYEQLIQVVSLDPDILECYAISGEYDFVLKICAESIDSLENKLLDLKHRGIAKSHTMFALRKYKFEPSALPDSDTN